MTLADFDLKKQSSACTIRTERTRVDASWKKKGFQSLQLTDFKDAPVAQMDRAADFESVGRVFEPPQARHSF